MQTLKDRNAFQSVDGYAERRCYDGEKRRIRVKGRGMAASAAGKESVELVDVEYVREAGIWYLRAYIDKEGGITVDDCEVVSRELGDWLDQKDFIEDSYILEVSSPGLGRPLKKEKDFARSLGKDVEVRLYRPINKQKEFTGTLKAYDADTVTLSMEDGTTWRLPSQISR